MSTNMNPTPSTNSETENMLLSSSQIWLEAKDVMSETVVTIGPNQSMGQAADMMSAEGVSSVLVMDGTEVIGLLTEHDFLRAVVAEGENAADAVLTRFMTSPVQSISPHRSILDASRLMETHGVKRLPVFAKDKLVGIISQTDLIRALTHVGTLDDVAAIMSSSVQTVSPESTVAEAAALMIQEGLSCLVAFSGDSPVGLLSERDMLAKVTARRAVPTSLQVREIMSYPVVSVTSSCSVFGAARTMDERRVHRLVVIDDGQLVGIVTQTDIFRAAKQRLQTEEAKGFQLLQDAHSCMFALDSSGTTVEVNPAFLRLFEVDDPDVFVNQPFLPTDFWPDPRERAYHAPLWERGLADIEELELQTAEGHRIYVSISATYMRDIHGQICGTQGVIRDLTARKMAEQATAIAYERLEKANRELKEMQSQIVQSEKLASIGQLAAGIAHEMNTPVGFVSSNLHTLNKYLQQIDEVMRVYHDLAGLINVEQHPELAAVLDKVQDLKKHHKIDFLLNDAPGLIAESKEGLERVTAIVQNLRDFSRIDQAENFDEYQINNGIEATMLVAQHELDESIEVRTELGTIPPVPCNAGQINQVILALLVNAAQALRGRSENPGQGHIFVKTFRREGWVYCEISDDGPGIASEHLPRLFEPFFTTKPAGKGTGLGLSAAYDIVVNKHHGELLVDSSLGQGSTFTLGLPLSVENEQP